MTLNPKALVPRSSCLHHAQKRALERYDLSLTFRELEVLSMAVRQVDPEIDRIFLTNMGSLRSIHLLKYKGHTLYGVYARPQKVLVTFLTEDMVRKYDPVYADASLSIEAIVSRTRKPVTRPKKVEAAIPNAPIKRISEEAYSEEELAWLASV